MFIEKSWEHILSTTRELESWCNLALLNVWRGCEGFMVMLAMSPVELWRKTFPYPQEESHSHGPGVCDVDEEEIICVPKYVMLKHAFWIIFKCANKELGILKQTGFHDVHVPALFWVRRSLDVCGVLQGEPSC